MMKMRNGIVAAIVVLAMFVLSVFVPISDETYAGETEFEAMIGGVGYPTLEEAMEAANKAEEPVVVEIQKDCIIEDKVLVNKTMTIDGNSHTITGTTKHMFRIGESDTEIEIVDAIFKDIIIVNDSSIENNSCINTRNYAGSLTMQNVKLESNHGINNQPLTIGTSHKITVDIDGCNISASGSGYAIITFVECDISITNSGLSGYSCVYIKSGSDNSTIIVKNSIMDGTNSSDGNDDDFGTIVIENYGQSLDNISIFIDESSEICSTKNGEAPTSAILISGSSVLPENYNVFLGQEPTLKGDAVQSSLALGEEHKENLLEEVEVVIDGEIMTYYMVKGSNPDAIYGFLGGSSSVEIDSDGEDSVMIPVVGTIDGNVDFDYDIVLPSGTVSIPSSVLAGLSDGATSVGVSMEAIELPPEYSYLPMGSVAYDVSVLIDDAPVHDLGGKIVVNIDASLPSRVIHILGNGLVEYPAFGIDEDGKLFIELTSLSDIVLDYTVDDDEEDDFIPTAPSTGSGDSGEGDDTTLYVACVAAAAVVAVLAILALTTNRN